MKTLSFSDLVHWCNESPSGVKIESTDHLHYAASKVFGFRIDIPSEAMRVVALVYSLLAVEEDTGYYGGVIWFTNWGMGTPQIEQCGLRILEQMRRGYGAVESVENTPGQLFRSDELVDTHAFMTLPLLWGWDAYFTPHGTRYFAYARQNGSLYLVTDDEQVFQKLRAACDAYHPVMELPTYLRLAALT
jgi:hypothetical protein